MMTLSEAADLAFRTLVAIPEPYPGTKGQAWAATYTADRERVASDLAGLRRHSPGLCARLCSAPVDCPDAHAYADGLRRTAALYGVTLRDPQSAASNRR